MGCFNTTCAISGLPIEMGDPVMFTFVQEDATKSSAFIKGIYSVRVAPVLAKYDDYGSIEDIEEGPMLDHLMAGFKADILERVHEGNYDPVINGDIGFEDLMEAVNRDRVFVKRALLSSPPSGIPELEHMPTRISVIDGASSPDWRLKEFGARTGPSRIERCFIHKRIWDGLLAQRLEMSFPPDLHYYSMDAEELKEFATRMAKRFEQTHLCPHAHFVMWGDDGAIATRYREWLYVNDMLDIMQRPWLPSLYHRQVVEYDENAKFMNLCASAAQETLDDRIADGWYD